MVGDGGIITSCKTTDNLVYAHWEGEDSMLLLNSVADCLDVDDKFLIWNSSFRDIYDVMRSKTSSNVSRRILTLSGNVILMNDLQMMKQVKR